MTGRYARGDGRHGGERGRYGRGRGRGAGRYGRTGRYDGRTYGGRGRRGRGRWMERTMPNSLFIYLTDGEKVEVNPHGYIPNRIFNGMKQQDYDKIMQIRSNAKKRNISQVDNNRNKNSNLSIPSRISTSSNDNASVQVSEISHNRTMMGGRNEQALIQSRGTRD